MLQRICFWIVFKQLLTFLKPPKELILCLKSKSCFWFFLSMGYWYKPVNLFHKYYFLGLP